MDEGRRLLVSNVNFEDSASTCMYEDDGTTKINQSVTTRSYLNLSCLPANTDDTPGTALSNPNQPLTRSPPKKPTSIQNPTTAALSRISSSLRALCKSTTPFLVGDYQDPARMGHWEPFTATRLQRAIDGWPCSLRVLILPVPFGLTQYISLVYSRACTHLLPTVHLN